MNNSTEKSINAFIKNYKASETIRLHMPGHKGSFGYEDDITEIYGADSLYLADGIILESENRTSEIFGSRHTFYGTEGSSQMIKTMCALAIRHSMQRGSGSRVIAASRNAHKSFIHASMLLGFDIAWLKSEGEEYSLCKCEITPEGLDDFLTEYSDRNEGMKPAAVYITSPDYLGNIMDIEGLAKTAHKYGTLLIVDNAHGAYLTFVEKHPVQLGADIVSDSAHKTFPVLTGGAYLHISENAPADIEQEVKQTMLMFGSTSPSYMIMKSLDMVPERSGTELYRGCEKQVSVIKDKLKEIGYVLEGEEPLKITIDFRKTNTTGEEVGNVLRRSGIECEYADREFLVTMWSPYLDVASAGERFVEALKRYSIGTYNSRDLYNSSDTCGRKEKGGIPGFNLPEVVYQPHQLTFSKHHKEKVGPDLAGRVAADSLISCPPAVSPIVAGERISEETLRILSYYNIEEIEVLNE